MPGSSIEHLLNEGLEQKIYSAASAGVFALGNELRVWSVGKTKFGSEGKTVNSNTLFDLASLTKVFATTSIIARLVDRKELALEVDIKKDLSNLPWHSKWKKVRVADVLTHQAGFMAWRDLTNREGNLKPGSNQLHQQILNTIVSTPPTYLPHSTTVYSDLGFILLGEWLRQKTKMDFYKLFEIEIRTPLKLSTMIVTPKKYGYSLEKIAATENISQRGGIIHGEVHDDNAFFFGGFAGNAGLFSSVDDCLLVGLAWLESCQTSSAFLSQSTAQMFTKYVYAKDKTCRTLGWDVPSGEQSSAGSTVSSSAIGHLGFTGTAIWIDLERQAGAVLLTNRVHPTAKNQEHRSFRSRFFDAVWEGR